MHVLLIMFIYLTQFTIKSTHNTYSDISYFQDLDIAMMNKLIIHYKTNG